MSLGAGQRASGGWGGPVRCGLQSADKRHHVHTLLPPCSHTPFPSPPHIHVLQPWHPSNFRNRMRIWETEQAHIADKKEKEKALVSGGWVVAGEGRGQGRGNEGIIRW